MSRKPSRNRRRVAVRMMHLYQHRRRLNCEFLRRWAFAGWWRCFCGFHTTEVGRG